MNFCHSMMNTRVLLEHEDDANKCDAYGRTPLHDACRYSNTDSNVETVRLLLEHKADVNKGDVEGFGGKLEAQINSSLWFSNVANVMIIIVSTVCLASVVHSVFTKKWS